MDESFALVLAVECAASDHMDAWVMQHCAKQQGQPVVCRHAVYATYGMSLAECTALWDDLMLERALVDRLSS